MMKMNEGKYRVTRFARDNKSDTILFTYILHVQDYYIQDVYYRTKDTHLY